MVNQRFRRRFDRLRSSVKDEDYDLHVVLPGEDLSGKNFDPRVPVVVLDIWAEEMKARDEVQ